MTQPNPVDMTPEEDSVMSSEEPVEGRCNNELENGEYCIRYPALSDDGDPIYEGAQCYFCAGGEEDSRTKHGLYRKRSEVYKALDPYDQAKVDEMIESMKEQSPYSRDNSLMMEQIRRIGIDIAKVWDANDYIGDRGMAQRKTVDVDDEGYPIKEDVENIMNIPVDRLERSITSRMKDHGIITEDPESRQAENTKTLAEVLSSSDE